MDQTNQSEKKHIYKPHIDISVNTKNMLHKYMKYDDTYEDVILRMINVYDLEYSRLILPGESDSKLKNIESIPEMKFDDKTDEMLYNDLLKSGQTKEEALKSVKQIQENKRIT